MSWWRKRWARRAPAPAPVAAAPPIIARIPTEPHEDRIAEHLASVQYSGTTPVFDQPLHLLAFVNRSGSNLLGEYLRRAHGTGGFEESLNWTTVTTQSDRLGIDGFADYITHLVGKRGGARGFGVKASGPQIAMLRRWNILGMFPAVRVVHIRREDIVAQAVSLHFATRTNQWTSLQKETAPAASVAYDATALQATLRGIQNGNNQIETVCAAAGLDRHSVSYERLVADPERTLGECLDFLGLAPADLSRALTRDDDAPSLEKQSSPEKSAMCQRFRRDLAGQVF